MTHSEQSSTADSRTGIISSRVDGFSNALCILAVAGTCVFLSWFKFKNPDGFFHLKIGQLILEQGRLLTTNTLSNLYADHPWGNPEWLFQVLLALAYQSAGWFGIAILKSSLAVALTLIVYFMARKLNSGQVASVALSLIFLSAVRFRITERPHLLSHVFFALTVMLVENYRRGEKGPHRVILPAIFAVWSNFHPGLIFGLIYLGAIALSEMALGRRARCGSSGRGRGLLIITLVCIGASLLNPLGYHVLTYGWEHREYHNVLGITEFMSAGPAAHPIFFLLAFLAVLAALLVKSVDVPVLLAKVIFFVLGVTYQRTIPDFSVLAVLVVAKALGCVGPTKGARGSSFVLAFIALVSILWCWNWDRNYTYRFGYGTLDDVLPAEAADFLSRESLPENLYNEFETGGYLAFRLFPRYHIFLDGRIPAYPRDFLITPHQRNTGASWSSRLAKYNINSAVIVIPLLTTFFRGDEWAVIHWDDRYAVVVRRSRAEPQLLERLEYQFYKPYKSLSSNVSVEVAQRTEEEMTRNLRGRRNPAWRVLLDLAHLKSLTGRRPEAIALIGEAEKILPPGQQPLNSLAQEWMFAGRFDLSAAAVERARRSTAGR